MSTALPSIPTATYRLQFHQGFRFADAAALTGYLEELGISHVYASPIFKSSPGSPHGYDICDHNALNPEIGSREDYAHLAGALRARHLGLILDFVPNHMGIAEPGNAWWMDVLEHGPSSEYAAYFDIDWHPLTRELENKVLLPILGAQYGRVLEKGELRLIYAEGVFRLHYYQTVLPVEPSSTRFLLQGALEQARPQAAEESVHELESIITAAEHLPACTDLRPEKIVERAREQRIIKRRLKALGQADPAITAAIERKVEEFQAPGDEQAYDGLDKLLNAQNYRLSFWRVAGEEINYRRFFDINSLAAIRMEVPEVFAATHRMIFELLEEGTATGLRIDHVDGLYDPQHYFELLQQKYAELRGLPPDSKGLYLHIEKILAADEHLRGDWAVHGTTGYEFANEAVALLVDETAQKPLTETYERFTEVTACFHDLAYGAKLLVMRSAMASEINVLGHMLNRLSETNRWYRDFTLNSLTAAVREVIACFPVYRTYIAPDGPLSEQGRRVITKALQMARRRNPALEKSVFDFLREVLLPTPGNPHAVLEGPRREFVMKFQQCSGPIAAKGVEDTAFYIYNRLVALNEVGGEPGVFGRGLEAFHAQQAVRQKEFPHCLLATSTHDTKRSEDVRARIAALSELPGEWSRAVRRWHMANRKFKRQVEGEAAPDKNEEYLLYQTLVGSWPLEPLGDETTRAEYVQRIQQYMEKALREAKVNSSWIEPNQAWDDAVRDFVADILSPKRAPRFLESIESFAKPVAQLGAINSLSQLVLKVTAPGVPDFYQGNEIWDFSLVDPDNRRPIDYALRRELLASLAANPSPAELLENWQDGRIKLFVTQRLLRFRREHPGLFQQGDYQAHPAQGEFASSCVAFSRAASGSRLLVVAPRLTARVGFPPVGDKWRDTALELEGRWKNIFTGAELSGPRLALAEVLEEFPVAVLASLP